MAKQNTAQTPGAGAGQPPGNGAQDPATTKAPDGGTMATITTVKSDIASAKADAKSFAAHVADAAKDAQKVGDAAAHAALENLLVHLHEFKSRLDTVEGHLDGDAAKVWKRIKEIL